MSVYETVAPIHQRWVHQWWVGACISGGWVYVSVVGGRVH